MLVFRQGHAFLALTVAPESSELVSAWQRGRPSCAPRRVMLITNFFEVLTRTVPN